MNIIEGIDGDYKNFGFYATNVVETENPQEAKKIAAILIHQNPDLKDTVLN
ncbi:MAG: hypothetical protein P8185_21105 [Deltaproteobacteria bacterium]